MRPTRWSVLALVAVVAGAVAYAVTRSSYDNLPRPTGYASLWLGLLAVAELYVALMTRARLKGRSGTRPVDPLVVARFVALAKASSLVGALAGGVYAGFLIWVVQLDTPTAHQDAKTAGLGTGFGLLLAAAAMFLEHVCRVPDDDDDEAPTPE
jgi:hypothetical protein